MLSILGDITPSVISTSSKESISSGSKIVDVINAVGKYAVGGIMAIRAPAATITPEVIPGAEVTARSVPSVTGNWILIILIGLCIAGLGYVVLVKRK